jgi:rubredoxin
MAQLDSTQCPDCAQAGIGYVYDSSNPDEREVA